MSEYGPVVAPEDLLRIVVSPFHVKKDRLVPAFLSVAEKRGMSTLRSIYVTDEELKLTAKQLVGSIRESDPSAGVFGVVTLKAEVIKAINDEGSSVPGFCIFDTALDDKPSHADVFQRVIDFPDNVKQARRQTLFSLVKSSFVPVDEFRAGLLMPWAYTAPTA